MRSLTRLAAAAALTAIAACQSDVTSPARTLAAPTHSSALLEPNEFMRAIVDSVDANGNIIMVDEYAAGTYTDALGQGGSVASVTIRTFIPATLNTGTSSGSCITSTIVAVETTPGWTSNVKKPGGCDKQIEVQFENAKTRQKAVFSFLYIAGKTRIDAGAVR